MLPNIIFLLFCIAVVVFSLRLRKKYKDIKKWDEATKTAAFIAVVFGFLDVLYTILTMFGFVSSFSSLITDEAVQKNLAISSSENAAFLMVDDKANITGNIFSVKYNDEIYFVTSLSNLSRSLSSDSESFKVDLVGREDISSSDLYVLRYSPTSDVVVLKPNNNVDLQDVKYFTLSTEPLYFNWDISIIGTHLDGSSMKDVLFTQHKNFFVNDNFTELIASNKAGDMTGSPVFSGKNFSEVIGVTTGISYDNGKKISIMPALLVVNMIENADPAVHCSIDEFLDEYPFAYYKKDGKEIMKTALDGKRITFEKTSDTYYSLDFNNENASLNAYYDNGTRTGINFPQSIILKSVETTDNKMMGYGKLMGNTGDYYINNNFYYLEYNQNENTFRITKDGGAYLTYNYNDGTITISEPDNRLSGKVDENGIVELKKFDIDNPVDNITATIYKENGSAVVSVHYGYDYNYRGMIYFSEDFSAHNMNLHANSYLTRLQSSGNLYVYRNADNYVKYDTSNESLITQTPDSAYYISSDGIKKAS